MPAWSSICADSISGWRQRARVKKFCRPEPGEGLAGQNRNQLVTGMVSYSPGADWGLSMGKHERVKDKAKPVSSDEATPQPKMALADNGPKLDLPTEKAESDPPKLEVPKLEAQ